MTKANDSVVKYIIKHIKKLDSKKRLVITLDGISGCGKTSISKRVAELLKDVTVLHADYFIYPYSKLVKKIEKFENNYSILYEKNWYETKNLLSVVNSFLKGTKNSYIYKPKRYTKNKEIEINLTNRILIVEGCFVSHDDLLGQISDSKIFLSLPKDSVVSRRKKRRIIRGLGEKRSLLSPHFHKAYKHYTEVYKISSKSNLHILMNPK